MTDALHALPVFRAAASETTRETYLQHIRNQNLWPPEQRELAADFLRSDACADELDRLRRGEGALPLPRQTRLVRNGKERTVYVLPRRDSILQGLLNYALHAWDDRFSASLYSNILGRGEIGAMARFRRTPELGGLHLFYADVHAFGDGIDAALLSADLHALPWLDPEFLRFADRLLGDRRYERRGAVFSDGPAVMTGTPLCCFFENVYLRELDFLLEARAAFYMRFADDILIGAGSREELDALAETTRRFLARKNLTLSERKCRVLEPGEAFPFLGLQIRGGAVDLTQDAVNVFQSAARRMERQLLDAFASKGLPPEKRLLAAVAVTNRVFAPAGMEKWFSVLSVPDGLRRVDRVFCDAIRTAASGKRGGGKYRVSYEMLRQCGYRSLVNRYYRYLSEIAR